MAFLVFGVLGICLLIPIVGLIRLLANSVPGFDPVDYDKRYQADLIGRAVAQLSKEK